MIAIIRRRKLGNGSTRGIKQHLSEMGIGIDIVRYDSTGVKRLENEKFRFMGTEPNQETYKGIMRWGYTGNIGFPDNKTINTAQMIHNVNNKADCRQRLEESNIKCPVTYYNKTSAKEAIMLGRRNIIGRPSRHAQGRNIVISNTPEDIDNDRTSSYWSEFVDKDKEYRVYTFFGRITMVAEKVPTEEGRNRIAWNHFCGGSVFENVRWDEWPIESCKMALKASNVIGIDFAGVDVMEKDGIPYILEINSAHSLTSEYRKRTFAKALKWAIGYMEEHETKPEHFPYPDRIRTYKSLILEAVRFPNGRE